MNLFILIINYVISTKVKALYYVYVSILINTAVLRKLLIIVLQQLFVYKGSHEDCWGHLNLYRNSAKIGGHRSYGNADKKSFICHIIS